MSDKFGDSRYDMTRKNESAMIHAVNDALEACGFKLIAIAFESNDELFATFQSSASGCKCENCIAIAKKTIENLQLAYEKMLQ